MEEFKVKNGNNMVWVIIGIITVISIFIYLYWYFNIRNIDIYTENFTPIGDINKEVKFSEDIGINLKEEALGLSLKYKAIVGWLRVPGTSIDFPIFQSKDNIRYSRNNRDNFNDGWGESYLDYRNNINNIYDMKNFIIYGHNTEEDSGFTPLLNYRSKKYLDNHKYIEFSTINQNYKWEIFSVYITTTEFFYIDTVFNDKEEYFNFISLCKSKSLYNIDVNVTKNDTILTLSTCEYSLENGRFVVQAKLVK